MRPSCFVAFCSEHASIAAHLSHPLDFYFMETRRLISADLPAAIQLLTLRPHHNVRLEAQLRLYGPAHEEHRTWGVWDGETLVALAHLTGWHEWNLASARPGEDIVYALAALVDDEGSAQRIMDNALCGRVAPLLQRFGIEDEDEGMEEAAVLYEREIRLPEGWQQARRATLADLPVVVAFWDAPHRMRWAAHHLEQRIRQLRIFILEQNGVVVSGAITHAETPTHALIGGVWTPPEHRQLGYAKRAVGALCFDLLREGRTPMLFHEPLTKNPAAKHLYASLGFTSIGDWWWTRVVRHP